MKEELKVISVPSKLLHPFFYSQHAKLRINGQALSKFNACDPFFYEAVFYSGIKGIKPWQKPEQYVPCLIKEWQTQKNFLHGLFMKRDRESAKEPMRIGTALFLELLFWTNGIPVDLSHFEQLDRLQFYPINVKERLAFIMNRPTLYHSYIQLTELMTEMEKQYSKRIVLRSRLK